MELVLNCTNGDQTFHFFLKSMSIRSDSEVSFDSHNFQNKVLGIKWNPVEDCLHISLPVISMEGKITKRRTLSMFAHCFDPLGLLAPIIINGKLLIQKLCMLNLDC